MQGLTVETRINPRERVLPVVEVFNREVAHALTDSGNAEIDVTNAAALAAADGAQSAHAARLALDNALFLNERHLERHENHAQAGILLWDSLVGDGAVTAEDMIESQRLKIDRIVADPDIGNVNARQATLLAGLSDEDIGPGERKTFVITNPDGTYTVYFGDESASRPVPENEIAALTERVDDIEVVSPVIVSGAVPIVAEELVGKKPWEVQALLEETFEARTGLEAGDTFEGVAESLYKVDNYNGMDAIRQRTSQAIEQQLTGLKDIDSPLLARRAELFQAARHEELLIGLLHPGIAATIEIEGPEALSTEQRDRLASDFPVTNMAYFDQVKLEDGSVVNDLERYGKHGKRQRENIIGSLLGGGTIPYETTRGVNDDITALLASDSGDQARVAVAVGVDRYFDHPEEVLADNGQSAYNNAVVEANKAAQARSRDGSSEQAALKQDMMQNAVNTAAVGSTFTLDGKTLTVSVPTIEQRRRNLEMTLEDKLAAIERADRVEITYEEANGNEKTITLGELSGDRLELNGISPEVRTAALVDENGHVYVNQEDLERLKDRVEQSYGEQPDGKAVGQVPVSQQPQVRLSQPLPPSEIEKIEAPDEAIVATADADDLNAAINERLALTGAIEALLPPGLSVEIGQKNSQMLAMVFDNPDLAELVIARFRGEEIDPNSPYADHPILQPVVKGDKTGNDAAFGLPAGTLNDASLTAEDIEQALDGVNGAGIVPGELNPWTNPSTIRRYERDVEINGQPLTRPDSWFDGFGRFSLNPLDFILGITPANAPADPPLRT